MQILNINVRPANRAMAWRWIGLAVGIALLCYVPVLLTERAIFGIRLSNMQLLNIGLTQVNLMLIMMLGSLSLTYLIGRAGLVSIGHAAFYAVGAMTAAFTGTQFWWAFALVLVAGAVTGAFGGALSGLPSLRVRGLYLLLATFAAHYIVEFLFYEYQYTAFDVVGVPYREAGLGPLVLDTPMRWYFFLLPLVAVAFLCLRNSLRTREGRALMAMRDHELAATSAGIDVRILRVKAFAFSSAVAAVAGALYAYYMTTVTPEFFSIRFAIQFIAIIIIGGMGSLGGSLAGAALWVLLPSVITGFADQAGQSTGAIGKLLANNQHQLVNLIFGMLVIVFLIFAPGGIAGMSRQIRNRLSLRRAK